MTLNLVGERSRTDTFRKIEWKSGKNVNYWKMAKMNMAIRGIDANFGDHPEDTFNDLHPTQKFDFIMANPPFILSNWGLAYCITTRDGGSGFHPQATQTTPG